MMLHHRYLPKAAQEILALLTAGEFIQGCHSEFGSNKVRKMVRQGKEKRLLARIFKILGKARKRLSRQNSTIKVRKCEEKRPEFTKKARKRLSRQNSTRKVRKCEEK